MHSGDGVGVGVHSNIDLHTIGFIGAMKYSTDEDGAQLLTDDGAIDPVRSINAVCGNVTVLGLPAATT
jgi:hypothetical protein